jgi:3'(2'), 5'-bisphosphate nucleotidase
MAGTGKEDLFVALRAAYEAGLAIMEVYRKGDYRTDVKKDLSPVTEADHASHRIIETALKETRLPLLSEEGREIPYPDRQKWDKFWLVDPLDGTKEFIRGNDEFTVNIALIEQKTPVMGIIYAPCQDTMYLGSVAYGAYRIKGFGNADWQVRDVEELQESATRLPLKKIHRKYVAIASRSHRNEQTDLFIKKLRREYPRLKCVSKGSSLKFCLLAEGKADIYPRFGPTMEWDTAAGHAIARASGCSVKVHGGDEELSYNKEILTNPWFIVNRIS